VKKHTKSCSRQELYLKDIKTSEVAVALIRHLRAKAIESEVVSRQTHLVSGILIGFAECFFEDSAAV